MSLFQEENYGKPISEKLSEYLRAYTDKDDRANVSSETGVSVSTIRDVSYRNNMVTGGNAVAMIALMKIAVVNCTNKIQHAKKAKDYMMQNIPVESNVA